MNREVFNYLNYARGKKKSSPVMNFFNVDSNGTAFLESEIPVFGRGTRTLYELEKPLDQSFVTRLNTAYLSQAIHANADLYIPPNPLDPVRVEGMLAGRPFTSVIMPMRGD